MGGTQVLERASHDHAAWPGSPPSPVAHPDALGLAAFLAGLFPAHPERSRIVELGCGVGANLIPIAAHHRNTEVVGVEGNDAAREQAVDAVRALGLDSVRLVASVAELEGAFHYVLVPDLLLRPGAELEPVLTGLRALLEPAGVAFVAHAMPAGLALRTEVAAALRASTVEARDVSEAIALARRGAEAMAAHLPLDEHPYARALAIELARAIDADDGELLRGYLLPAPEALRRGELEARAADAGLTVLAELGPTTADPRAGEALRMALAPHGESFAVEAWADVLQGRDVRWLALARSDAPLSPPPGLDAQLAFGRLASPLVPVDPDPWLGPRAPLAFRGPDGSEVVLEHPAEKAALLVLARAWPAAMPLGRVIEEAALLLRSGPVSLTLDAEGAHRIALRILELRRHRRVRTTLRAIHGPESDASAPRVAPLTRLEAERGALITTAYHDVVALDPIERLLVARLDGRPLAAVAAELRELVDDGTLAFFDGAERWSPHDTLAVLNERLPALAQRLAHAAVLV